MKIAKSDKDEDNKNNQIDNSRSSSNNENVQAVDDSSEIYIEYGNNGHIGKKKLIW